ncbi:AAA family ATPase [Dokdonella immobilis]|uniref:Predicted ATPase n=1 Tax=Dokdonella immobilis TaxID=578942 RepID=A0A1I4Y9J4_9GAMM|nr:DUF3696 domain-containing protein [Dokdonella immobilis]SFN34738.1 Predicted ATPase [Dokdonella immobilis]
MIRKLSLQNFKSFRESEISFGMLTLLSGINGSGKSTILQSLGALKQSFDAGSLGLRGGLLLNGEYVELGVGKDVLCEYSDAPNVGISVETDDTTHSWTFAYAESDDMLLMTAAPPPSAGTPRWLSSGFQFLRADRIAPAVVYPKSYNESVRRRFLGIHGQYAPYFLSVHQDEQIGDGRLRQDGTSSRLLDQVNAWLSEISPGVSVSAVEIGGADLAQLLFRYGGSAGLDSSNDYRPTNVGFGLSHVLPIITACLAARTGDIVILENPEAHLHPRGQVVMGELLSRAANDGVQVIVESHSDHLLNGMRLAVKNSLIRSEYVKLHFCRRKKDGRGSELTSPNVDSGGRVSEWPPGFFDEWERTLMDLV